MPRVTTLREVGNSALIISQNFDVVLLAVDGDEAAALKTIEALCRAGSTTPMAYSESSNDDLLIRCMRAGVREFLVYPFAPGVIEEAFSRAHSRGGLSRTGGTSRASHFFFSGPRGARA